ncbi:MAG: hypothetical protein K6E49_04590 [Lachnospiraceae bacterium]|nr:hypothetical protein [Lachnospiraceae bacterium]
MTVEDMEFLKKINDFAEKELGDIDPQKTHVSEQLEKLRPIMQKLAMEYKMEVEDVFIRYMDLASEANVTADREFRDRFGEDDVLDLPIQ